MKLLDWRKRQGKTQGWLAEATGISQTLISKYEHGIVSPRSSNAKKLAEVTQGEVTADDWPDGKETKAPTQSTWTKQIRDWWAEQVTQGNTPQYVTKDQIGHVLGWTLPLSHSQQSMIGRHLLKMGFGRKRLSQDNRQWIHIPPVDLAASFKYVYIIQAWLREEFALTAERSMVTSKKVFTFGCTNDIESKLKKLRTCDSAVEIQGITLITVISPVVEAEESLMQRFANKKLPRPENLPETMEWSWYHLDDSVISYAEELMIRSVNFIQ